MAGDTQFWSHLNKINFINDGAKALSYIQTLTDYIVKTTLFLAETF